MQTFSEVMRTAVDVLGAIRESHYPDPADVAILQKYAPLWANLPPDELACEIIHNALKLRDIAEHERSPGSAGEARQMT